MSMTEISKFIYSNEDRNQLDRKYCFLNLYQDRNFCIYISLTGQKSLGQKLSFFEICFRTEISRTDIFLPGKSLLGQK